MRHNNKYNITLSDYLAKPEESLQAHTEKVCACSTLIKKLGYIDEETYDLLYAACFYHDFGKMNRQFQERVGSSRKIYFDIEKEVPHHILSVCFIEKEHYDKKSYKMICQLVINHHFRGESNGQLFKELLPRIKEWADENYKITENEIESVLGRVKSTLLVSEKIDDETKMRYIKLLGLLNKCDYAASGNYQIEYPNDFLTESTCSYIEKLSGKSAELGMRAVQKFAYEHTDQNVIIVAQTGMGKTEAGLLWIGNHKGYFVLPLRVAINSIYHRISNFIIQEDIEYKIGILHSQSKEEIEKHYDNKSHQFDNDIESYYRRGKNLSLPLTVTTLDQLFTFVYKYRGFELTLGTLSYSKLVIDEIQVYSADLLAYLIYGVEWIMKMGGKVAIMTATLPPFVEELLNKEDKSFKKGVFIEENNTRHNICTIDNRLSLDAIMEICNENDIAIGDKKLLIICNTVKDAQKLFDEFNRESHFNVNLFHSRFIKKDRRTHEERLLKDGQTNNIKPSIWITTKIVEASVDIDFDFLFVELSDYSSLMQAMGRCNRKGIKTVEEHNVFVFTEIDENLITVSKDKPKMIDAWMFEFSKNIINSWHGKVTEKDKLLGMDKFTLSKVKESHYFSDYQYYYKKIKDIPYYATDKASTMKIFRNIDTVTIIPYLLVDDDIRNLLDQFAQANSFSEFEKINKILLEVALDIPRYHIRTRKGMFVKDAVTSKFGIIYVFDCNYDSVRGFEIIKETRIMANEEESFDMFI